MTDWSTSNPDLNFLKRMTDAVQKGKIKDPYSQNTWVRAAIDAIARAVAGIGGNVYTSPREEQKDGEEKIVDNSPAARSFLALLDKPSPLFDRYQFLQMTITLLERDGGVFWLLEGADGGYVASETAPVTRAFVTAVEHIKPVKDDAGFPIRWTYTPGEKAKNRDLQLFQAVYIRFPNPNGYWEPLSPYEAVRDVVETDNAARIVNKYFFENGAHSCGSVSFPGRLDEKEAAAIQKVFEERYTGPEAAGRVRLIAEGGTYTPDTGSRSEMQFLEGRKDARDEILMNYGVPKAVVGATEDLNYATYVGQWRVFWTNTVRPLLEMLEAVIFQRWGLFYQFDIEEVDAMLKDRAAQVDLVLKLQAAGIPVFDACEIVGMECPDYPWLRTWWKPFGLADVQEETPSEETPVDEPSEEPSEEPVEPDEEPAAGDPSEEEDEPIDQESVRRLERKAKIQRWNEERIYDPHEKSFLRFFRGYFNKLRKDVLKRLDGVSEGLPKNADGGRVFTKANVEIDQINFDPDEWDKILLNTSSPYYSRLATSVLEQVGQEIGDISFSLTDPRMVEFLRQKALKVRTINVFMHEQLREVLLQGTAESWTVDQIANAISGKFNVAKRRALTIARTETNQTANGTRMITYQAEGVALKSWSTSMDEKVRETHVILGRTDPVPIDYDYSPDIGSFGRLLHPGDILGEAKEVINCRCTILAED